MSGVLLESRPFRPFKSSEEYLYAMKEDLAEWLQMLYPHLRINVENFMDRLETGVALCEVSVYIQNLLLDDFCSPNEVCIASLSIIIQRSFYKKLKDLNEGIINKWQGFKYVSTYIETLNIIKIHTTYIQIKAF